MKSFLADSKIQTEGGSIEFNYGGNDKNWFCKQARVQMEDEPIPTMTEMFRTNHADMFDLLDRRGEKDINLSIHADERSNEHGRGMYADGGNVATTTTQPTWTTGAQPMAEGGSSKEMHVDWSNGQMGRILK